jgi:tetratricopeptide (TPR) repeat protein
MALSLCMIVRDEADKLAKCIASVRPLVDSMIIVDTGSRDRTVEIAQEWGAIVHTFEWINDFAAARNAALQYVQTEWVLILDADEVLIPDCIPLVQQVMQSSHLLVANLLRQEQGAVQSPYSLVSRLFRKHPALHFSRPYHESIDDSVLRLLQQEPQWQVTSLPGVAISHSGYQPTLIAERDKANRAKTAMASYLSNHPEDAYLCSKLGSLYVSTGRCEQGINILQRGLNQASIESSTRYELHYHLGLAHSKTKAPDLAIQQYQLALQQDVLPPLKLGAYNNLGSILHEHAKLAEAKAVFQAALTIDPNFAIGQYNLGLVLKSMGNFSAAIAHYRRAIALNAQYPEAYQNLAVTLFKVGQVPESLQAFQAAIKLYEQQGSPAAEQLREGIRSLGLPI